MNSLKVFSVIAGLGIVATAAVGGVALANNADLKSGINAAASDHSLVFDTTNVGAYSDTSSDFVVYGWTVNNLHAGVSGSSIKIFGGTNGGLTESGAMTFPTCNRTAYSGAYLKTVTFAGLAFSDSSATDQFVLHEVDSNGTKASVVGSFIVSKSGVVNLNDDIVSFYLTNGSNSTYTTFTSLTVTYNC
jgi:hypothetical protein